MSEPAEASDAELAARAARGEDHAFTMLMRRYKGGLHRFVIRHVGDADAAYEVVQETFVSAWKALARYDDRRPFDVWLRAIALNKCRDRGRRLAVRRLILGGANLESPEARRQADASPGAETSLLAAQRHAALDAAIAKLPARLKEPLLLTYFDNLSHQEAAAVLGVTPKAIETRVHRARRKLAALMAVKFE